MNANSNGYGGESDGGESGEGGEPGEPSNQSGSGSRSAGVGPGAGSSAGLMLRLSGLMGLAYAAWGAWWPILSVHLSELGFSGRERAWIYAACPIASILAPLGMGQLADRLWPLQRCLAMVFAVGSILLAVQVMAGPSSFAAMFPLMMAYWLIAAPTGSLANAMAMRNLPRPNEQFARVRLWGTAGWMIAAWASGLVAMGMQSAFGWRTGESILLLAAIFSAIGAGYCVFLPHTPPLKSHASANGSRAGDMLDLLRNRSILIYLVLAFGVSSTTPFMYQVIPPYLKARGLDEAWIGPALSLGQVPEIIALFCLPWCLSRWGHRVAMAVGIGCWVIRFGTLAFDPPVWLAVATMPLHGMAVAFFAVAGQMYLDSHAPPHRRASSQALNLIVASGLGSLVGSLIGGEAVDRFGTRYDWIFLVPTLVNFALLMLLAVGFRPVAANGAAAARPRRASEPRALPAFVAPASRRPALDQAAAS